MTKDWRINKKARPKVSAPRKRPRHNLMNLIKKSKTQDVTNDQVIIIISYYSS